jgi:hypothetical protein
MTEVEDARPRGLRRLSPIELGMGEIGGESPVPSGAMALDGLAGMAGLGQVGGRDPSLANVTEGLASAGLPGGGSGMIPPMPGHKSGSSGVISGAESAVSGLVQTGGPDDDSDLIGFSSGGGDYSEPKRSKPVSYGIGADEANVYDDDDDEEEETQTVSRKRTSFRTDEDEETTGTAGEESSDEDEEWESGDAPEDEDAGVAAVVETDEDEDWSEDEEE